MPDPTGGILSDNRPIGGLSSSSINPHAPATSLPGVPRNGATTQTDTLMALLQKQTGNELARYALMADARGRALTAMSAKALAGGKNAKDFLNSDEGKLANLALSSAVNGGMFGLINTGGNNLNLMAGIGNAAGSGLNMNFDTGGGGTFGGRGATTDAFTKALFDRVNENFYGDMGAARLHRTHGMDRDQLGEIFTRLAQAGSFSGLDAGTIRHMKGQNGAQDYLKADINPETAKFIEEQVSQSAGAIARMQSITGTKDVGETMRLASSFSGMSFSSPNAPRLIESQIEKMQNTADALQLNPGALISDVVNRGGGPLAQMAVATASAITKNNQTARTLAAQNGFYMPELDRERMGNIAQAGITAAAMQEHDINGAAWLMENSDIGRAHAPEIMQKIQAVANAGNPQEHAAAQRALRTYMTSSQDGGINATGGGTLAGVEDAAGGAAGVMRALSPGLQQKMAGIYRDTDQSQRREQNINSLFYYRNFDTAGTGAEARTMAPGTTRDLYKDMEQLLTTQQQEELTQAVSTGDWTKASTLILKDSNGTPKERQDAWNRLQGAVASQGGWTDQEGGGGKKVGGALREARAAVASSEWNAAGEGPADRADRERREFQADMNRTVFGDGTAETGGYVETFLRGAANGENVSDRVALEYLQASGAKDKIGGFGLRLNADGSYTSVVSDDQAADLSKIKGLGAALGLKDTATAAEIKAAMESKDGGQKALQFMKDQGMAINKTAAAKDKDGNVMADVAYTSAENKEASVKEVEAAVKRKIAEKFKFDPKDELGLQKKLAEDPKLRAEVMAGDDKEKKEMMLADDKLHPEIALPQIDKELAKQEKISKDNSGPLGVRMFKDRADEKVKNLKEEKAKLTDDKGKEGDMIGRVKMILDDSVITELYKQRQ
jgi:hypothetical protein